MNWYYATGEERLGPYTAEQFQELVQQGMVTAQTLVWREGMTDWRPHGSLGNTPSVPTLHSMDSVTCAICAGNFPRSETVLLVDGYCCANCKPLAVQRLKEGVIPSSQSDEIRKQYLTHEASVKSIGLLYYPAGVICFLAGVYRIVISVSFYNNAVVLDQIIGMGVCLLALGIAQFWVARGLRGLKRWSRIPTGIVAGFGLLVFPLGTLINAYVLYLIFSKKGKMVFSDEYRVIMDRTPHIKYRTSVLIWVLLGLVVVLIVFGLMAAIFFRQR